MAVFIEHGESIISHQLGRVSLHPEKSGLEVEVKTLRTLENLLRKKAPGLRVMHELVQRRKLAELQMFSLTRQAVATLEASSPKGGKSND